MTACFDGIVSSEVFVEPGDRVFFTRIEVSDEDRKLVAAEPRDDVGASKTAVEYCRGVDECVVAFVVTEFVVDALHAVEVDKEQQQVFFLPAREVEVRRGLFE